jgi:hypothetical protein
MGTSKSTEETHHHVRLERKERKAPQVRHYSTRTCGKFPPSGYRDQRMTYTLPGGVAFAPRTRCGWFFGRPNSQVSSPKHWYAGSVDLPKFGWLLCQVGRPGVRGRMSAKQRQAKEKTKVQPQALSPPWRGVVCPDEFGTLGKARWQATSAASRWKR